MNLVTFFGACTSDLHTTLEGTDYLMNRACEIHDSLNAFHKIAGDYGEGLTQSGDIFRRVQIKALKVRISADEYNSHGAYESLIEMRKAFTEMKAVVAEYEAVRSDQINVFLRHPEVRAALRPHNNTIYIASPLTAGFANS